MYSDLCVCVWGGVGTLTEKVVPVQVCPVGKTPLSHLPLSPLFRYPLSAWFSSLDPTFTEKYLKKIDWLLQVKFVKKIKESLALQPKLG